VGAATAGTGVWLAEGRGAGTKTTDRYVSLPDFHPPIVTVRLSSPSLAPGLILVALGGPFVFDNHGEPVWYRAVPGKTTTDLRVQTLDGAPVLSWWQGALNAGHGAGEIVVVDTSYREVTRLRAGNGLATDLHECTITPTNTALLAAYAPRTADLTQVGGDRHGTLLDSVLQEVDIATGKVLLEWRASEHIALSESHVGARHGTPYDFFHINSATLDRDGDIIVSARNTWAAYKINRRSGRIVWRLGGKRSNYRMTDGATFAWQHDVMSHEGDVTLFDDEATPKVGSQSRGLRLHLDEATHTARVVQQYVHPDPLLAGTQGSMQPLADGHAFVGWGAQPYVSEFSGRGALLFDAHLGSKTGSYRAYRAPWRARPADPPALAVARHDGGPRRAYASWNGATDIASWRLDAGAHPDSLARATVVRRSGFETSIPIPNDAKYVAVTALDASGGLLGTSRSTAVSDTVI
jgi:hypothetical protein